MTVFKTSDERRNWIDVRCMQIGQRLQAECDRLKFDPTNIAYDSRIELHKMPKWPRLAAGLRAEFLALVALSGVDMQFVLSGKRSDNAPTPEPDQPLFVIPPSTKADKTDRDKFVVDHRKSVAKRVSTERTRLGLDLEPIGYLSNVEASALTAGHEPAADTQADFLSLLAERGMDTQYVLTGVRSVNWPA